MATEARDTEFRKHLPFQLGATRCSRELTTSSSAGITLLAAPRTEATIDPADSSSVALAFSVPLWLCGQSAFVAVNRFARRVALFFEAQRSSSCESFVEGWKRFVDDCVQRGDGFVRLGHDLGEPTALGGRGGVQRPLSYGVPAQLAE